MKLYATSIAHIATVFCLTVTCHSVNAQSTAAGGASPSSSPSAPTGAGVAGAATSNGGVSAAGTSTSANPLSRNNPGSNAFPTATNNSPGNPLSRGAPTGLPPSNSAQPGQTGSSASQRVNAMNQAYQDQQQSQSSQRLRNEQQPNDINQLAPSVAQPGFAPLGVGVHSPLDRASARESGGVAPTFDRGYIINDLRQQGFAVDDWRVVNQNGRWWFWSPDNSWLYFNDGINGSGAKAAWVPYRGNLNRANDGNSRLHNFAVPAGYPAENWRLVEHEGRMWFWTPDRTWMYFSGGRWNDYPAGGYVDGGDRYRVGYRGGNLDPVQPRGVAGPIYRDAGPSQTTNPVRAEGNPLRAQDEAGMNVDAED